MLTFLSRLLVFNAIPELVVEESLLMLVFLGVDKTVVL